MAEATHDCLPVSLLVHDRAHAHARGHHTYCVCVGY
jgi:hypothetical protein